MKDPSARVFLLTLLTLALLASTLMAQPPESDATGWAEVDRLTSEDQYEAASRLVADILQAAREAGDEDEWTRALVRQVQLRTGLHGVETAVRFLRQEPWPESPRHRLTLELFYANSLATYAQAYSWEIRQRERVVSTDEVDLKAWTLDQTYAEAQQAFFRVWQERETWGDASLGELAEYFEPGNYPAHVRGTLRDAVTYLWVGLLADTSMWRPEHSNEIFRLDLSSLLSDEPPAADLGDPAVHPLAKTAAVLADLEAWHRAGGRPEAAFEARLERLRRLWASFTQEDDREAVRRDLEAGLDELGRQFPWWSLGMAQLAEFLRQGDGPNALVEAREAALEGERTHPESVGGQRCRHLVAAIEQPGYQLAAMQSDSPDRRSIQVRHKNLGQLFFRAYALDLVATVEKADDRSLLPAYRDLPGILARQDPVAEWSVELPATPDYRWHQTYVTPPLERPSLYVVVASTRRDFAERFNQRAAVRIVVGDLVLLRTSPDSPGVRVVSGRTGAGLAGVAVDLYRYDYRRGHQKVEEKTTGDAGEVSFDAERTPRESYFVLAHRGADVALQEGFRMPWEREPSTAVRSLVYTDRSVYRPRQTVFWKVVAYRQLEGVGRFEVFPQAGVIVELLDTNGEQVAAAEVETNGFGSAAGEFEIPAGRLLGQWQIRTRLRDDERAQGQSWIRVEEYKRPTFEVEIGDPASSLRLNRPATLSGEVRYYFGLPVTAGDVAWRVTREPVRSWWYRSFGYRSFGRPIRPENTAPQTIASGAAELDQDGRFEVTFTPEADERLAGENVSYRYRLSVDVTDEGGETRSDSRAFRLGFVAVEAIVADPPGFFRAGEGAGLTVVRSDLDGHPRPGAGRWRILELEQPEQTLLPADRPLPEPEDERYRTPGDRLRPRWDFASYSPRSMLHEWPDGPERRRGTLEHGEEGKALVSLAELPPGVYRLRYATDDEFGATFETAYELLVLGETPAALAVPGLLEAERTSVAVGSAVRLAVGSGLADQELELAIYRGDEVERRRLESGEGVRLIEIPARREDRGGFGVVLTLVRDHQLVSLDQRIFVPWDDRALQVEFATFRDKMRPGETESWTVRVKGADDAVLAAGTAELLAYMYDKSLDLFAPHSPPDPLSLYPRRNAVPAVTASLGEGSQIWTSASEFGRLPAMPGLQPGRLKFLDGYGIGGPGRRSRAGVRTMAMAAPAPRAAPAPLAAARVPESAGEPVWVGTEAPITFRGGSPRVEAEAAPQAAAPPPDALRADFSETAFWEPHLVIGDDGSASFEFTAPDSLTEWSVWVHALTRDLRSGRLERQVRTAKELMVRPYVPRFFREGDRAELRVVVNNAGEKELRGTLDFDVRDPETEESLNDDFGLEDSRGLDFTVEPGGGTELSFAVRVPPRVGTVAFEARARAGDWSDGERRPLPVLPSRVHLAQSRFVALHDRDRRVMRFDDLAADDDPTRIDDQLVVTLDAQLFYSVLHALPYLVEYPYECTEQLLNRFLSTGIVSTLYAGYPAVARMAERFAERETRLETWDEADPNRKMLLEETPWLVAARGGETPEEGGLVNVLDPKIAASQRDASLAKLRQAQTSSGGFPWWPGGPPSPFMTLYLLDGFSRALEFGVEVPQDVVTRAWDYLHRYYVDEVVRDMVADERCWETVTYLSYVLSNYPDVSWTGGVFTDDDRETMLEFSLRHWREHSPRLKCYLALTLHRADRGGEARTIFASVMDSAETTQDQGTFWAPEDRAWLWYNDTTESHAFALRTLLELEPEDARRHGLVQWLFLDKHLSHWKSTRATAEVIYSLVHYLEREGALMVREQATVTAGAIERTFTFEPDAYTGKENRILIGGDEVGPSVAEIEVSKESPGFLFASATWHFSTERLPEEARGDFFSVTRKYFRRVHDGREWVLEPLSEGAAIAVGDELEVRLSLRAKHAAEYVHLRDPRGAGFEPVTLKSGFRWDLGLGYYEEVRDSGANFFFEWLPVGEYTFKYRLRANVAGTFRVGPATLQSMYAPEFVGYSSGSVLEISR